MIQALDTQDTMRSYVGQNRTITETQQQALSAFLTQYDAQNLSDASAKEIVAQIKELGIRPGAGLTEVLSEAGIDAPGLAEQAGVERPDRPPPPGGGSNRGGGDDAVVSLIADAVSAYDPETAETSLGAFLDAMLENAGYNTSTSLFDYYV